MRRREFDRPSAAEERAIRAGFDRDPDTYELSDKAPDRSASSIRAPAQPHPCLSRLDEARASASAFRHASGSTPSWSESAVWRAGSASAPRCAARGIGGTKNAGIRRSGSAPIGAAVISPGAPVLNMALEVPNPTAMKGSENPESIPADECGSRGEARLTRERDAHPGRREADRHVAEAGRQREGGRQHVICIQEDDPQSRPPPCLHAGDELQIEGEDELTE